tara:strand:+ start:935 stop:1138 length:204 start_codon:yes stop_codon:yes gene_type:complete
MKPINNLLLQYKEFILESQTILDYFLIAWAHLLGAIFVTGLGRIIYELIFNPSTFRNATWGIFDTLG